MVFVFFRPGRQIFSKCGYKPKNFVLFNVQILSYSSELICFPDFHFFLRKSFIVPVGSKFKSPKSSFILFKQKIPDDEAGIFFQ